MFGRDGVHVIVFDDFAADAGAVYRSTLEFVGVDPNIEVDLSVHNPNRTARSGRLSRLVFAPPRPLRGAVGTLRRVPLAHRIRDALVSANSRQAKRAPMDAELRRRLTVEFKPQVAELGELIGRDLSAWSET